MGCMAYQEWFKDKLYLNGLFLGRVMKMLKIYHSGTLKTMMMQIMCTHVCKWKNEICWNCSRNGGRGLKENGGGGEFNYDMFDIL
jgi:hypothetical protein